MDELSIHDLIAIWRRRKVVYFVTLAVFLAIGLVFVFSWSRYKSIATVAIQQPDIPQNMTAPASQTAMNGPNPA